MKFCRLFYLVTISCALVLSACKKKENTTPQLYFDYFGLVKGRYIDYSVTEIQHDVDQSIQHDTNTYFLRTVIGDTIMDNQGRAAFKFIRYKRQDSQSPWLKTDIWTAIIEDSKAELVEENQRLIKLVFAPTLTKEWNTNQYNMLPELNCFYRDIHVFQNIGATSFDSTLVVEQENVFSMIDHRRKFEVYAKGVGLVYKHFRDLKISGFDTLNVQKGKEMYYRCIGYGFQ